MDFLQWLKDWGAVASAVIALGTLGALILRQIKKLMKQHTAPLEALKAALDNNNAATCAALKYSIVRAHEDYIKAGKIGRLTLECVLDMFGQYQALGGNGFVEELVADLRELPADLGR